MWKIEYQVSYNRRTLRYKLFFLQIFKPRSNLVVINFQMFAIEGWSGTGTNFAKRTALQDQNEREQQSLPGHLEICWGYRVEPKLMYKTIALFLFPLSKKHSVNVSLTFYRNWETHHLCGRCLGLRAASKLLNNRTAIAMFRLERQKARRKTTVIVKKWLNSKY